MSRCRFDPTLPRESRSASANLRPGAAAGDTTEIINALLVSSAGANEKMVINATFIFIF